MKDKFVNIIKINKIDYKTYVALLTFSLLPSIWILIRSHIITTYISPEINTYAQWTYLNTALEVLQEMIILPLFYWLGISFVKNDTSNSEVIRKIKTIFICVFSLYIILFSLFTPFIGSFINFINNNHNQNDQTNFFIWQLWSKVPQVLLWICITVLILQSKYISTLILGFLNVILGLVMDFLFSSQMGLNAEGSYSLIGVSSFVSTFIVFVAALLWIINSFGWKNFFRGSVFQPLNDIWKIMVFSGLDSAVRNFFYIMFFARMMNTINGTDAYWLANSIIWGWMLMPINTLSHLHKSQTAINLDNKEINKLQFYQFQLFSFLIFLSMMVIFIPLWKPMAYYMCQDRDISIQSFDIMKMLIGFYIFFSFTSMATSFFYGTGKTHYLLIQSLINNSIIYLPTYIFWLVAKTPITLEAPIYMFGSSLIIGGILNWIFVWITFRSKGKNYILEKKINKSTKKYNV